LIQGHAAAIFKNGAAMDGAMDAQDEATAYLAETISTFSSAAEPFQAFWFWNRTRREIGLLASSVFASAGGVFCPFLDRRLVKFCLSLPFDVTRDLKLHDEAIARAYPHYSDIPYGESFPETWSGGGSVYSKLKNAALGAKTILSLHPNHPLREIGQYLKGSDAMARRPAEVRQLYRLALENLDADTAKHLLKITKLQHHPNRDQLISQTYEPEKSHVG